jgi:Uroporphyrinogen decarboxylase (URO-D)
MLLLLLLLLCALVKQKCGVSPGGDEVAVLSMMPARVVCLLVLAATQLSHAFIQNSSSSFTLQAVKSLPRCSAKRCSRMRMAADGEHDILLRVARGEKADRSPVWLMRQAGRYMSAFR